MILSERRPMSDDAWFLRGRTDRALVRLDDQAKRLTSCSSITNIG
jgi:hypothetical protein